MTQNTKDKKSSKKVKEAKHEPTSSEIIKPKNDDFNKIFKKTKNFISSALKNPYFITFLIILTIALTLRLRYFNMESIWNDAAVHLWYAIQVTKNPLIMFSQKYILGDYFIVQTITGIVYLFTKNAFLAGKIVALVFSLTSIYLIY